jgi:hypothetical protein
MARHKGTEVHPAFEVILEKAQQAEFWIALVIFFFKTNERQQSTLPGI